MNKIECKITHEFRRFEKTLVERDEIIELRMLITRYTILMKNYDKFIIFSLGKYFCRNV